MSSQILESSDPISYFRRALVAGQFWLYCQPICEAGAPLKYPIAEVLIRLREEEQALLPPGDFFPVLEEYGQMPTLDRWVVRQVLLALSKGSRIPRFSVNLSRQTIADAGFAQFFAAEIQASKVPAKSLIFEIDETDILRLADCAAALAADIRSVGAAVLIDSFGRDPNAFSYLKALRADFIKLDESLTRSLLTADLTTTRLNSILRFASCAGVGVIADRVEDAALLSRLKAVGIGYAQGYGVHRPEPIERFAQLPSAQAA
jgi:EAL domain-containing protein (putative c-di-GMP-specific phosphodiesterase class I)